MFIGNSYAFPSSILYFSIVHITNTQNISTSQPFQQMLNVSYSLYKGYAASNFQNVEFFYSNGTIIPSWLEGYNYSRNAIYWLKIGSIPASSSITIYIGFALNSTNLFNNKTTGEAPQLSSTYAEYDDGANIFLAYFNGDTPTSDFNLGTGVSMTQVTGVTMPNRNTGNVLEFSNSNGEPDSSSDWFAYAFKTALPNEDIVLEAVLNRFPQPRTTDLSVVSLGDIGTSSYSNAVGVYMGWDSAYFSNAFTSSGSLNNDINQQGSQNTNWNYYTMIYIAGSPTFSGFIAPQFYSSTGGYSGSATNPIPTSTSNLYMGDYYSNNYAAYYIDYYRARAYPPNGVMPSVSFGSVA